MSDWRRLALRAADMVGTPCYVLAEQPLLDALAKLNALESSVRLRHWMSLKTQPVREVMRAALDRGLGIDVVSECEFIGALSAGVPTDRILVNGVAKHRWLSRHRVADLAVHFDSLAEVRSLALTARALNWHVGLRCAVSGPDGWDQFGLNHEEAQVAADILADADVAVAGLHFHLHTNVRHVDDFRRALAHVAGVAAELQLSPEYIDVGGGLPIAGEHPLQGPSAASTFDVAGFRDFLASIPRAIASVTEVWLENGRHLTGPAGALVVTVLDRKQRGDSTYLICDGGRVNHARMAAIERHELLQVPSRGGSLRPTIVCGPTCSAVDQLGRWMLPESIEPGDHLIWLTAGAYHIPLETRFSTGLAPVVWFDEHDEPAIIRARESPAEWWGRWLVPKGDVNVRCA